ncbi:hypothetical protein E2C01_040216 [Portunus trituberculatus]|uniref:Uncharacterized protein n=1 Tax=Portunus trituberculatus TaxID=210409 RepID=A0A5B7FLY1_PORTR|nr:hypothetical protein [Portunus trituberculatus]
MRVVWPRTVILRLPRALPLLRRRRPRRGRVPPSTAPILADASLSHSLAWGAARRRLKVSFHCDGTSSLGLGLPWPGVSALRGLQGPCRSPSLPPYRRGWLMLSRVWPPPPPITVEWA